MINDEANEYASIKIFWCENVYPPTASVSLNWRWENFCCYGDEKNMTMKLWQIINWFLVNMFRNLNDDYFN